MTYPKGEERRGVAGSMLFAHAKRKDALVILERLRRNERTKKDKFEVIKCSATDVIDVPAMRPIEDDALGYSENDKSAYSSRFKAFWRNPLDLDHRYFPINGTIENIVLCKTITPLE